MKHYFVFERDFDGAVTLTARAGTNGLQCGDAGHGGQAIIDLKCNSVSFEFIKYKDQPGWIRIIANGDSEIELLLESLKWCCQTLEREIDNK
jgi:hypothetical protein